MHYSTIIKGNEIDVKTKLMFNEKTRVDSGKPTNIIENNKDGKIRDEFVNKNDTWNNGYEQVGNRK